MKDDFQCHLVQQDVLLIYVRLFSVYSGGALLWIYVYDVL